MTIYAQALYNDIRMPTILKGFSKHINSKKCYENYKQCP